MLRKIHNFPLRKSPLCSKSLTKNVGPSLSIIPKKYFSSNTEEIRQAVADQARMSSMFAKYRQFGHEIAKTSPLETINSNFANSFKTLKQDPTYFNYTKDEDLDHPVEFYSVKPNGIQTLKKHWSPREAENALQEIYCGSISFEYMHISSDVKKEYRTVC